MFTGLIEDVGVVEAVVDAEAGRELRIRCRYHDLALGESVAVNGVCLTVRDRAVGWFTAAAVVTTLGRTDIDSWEPGKRVNLERAMRLGDRLGGHLVQGHVDGVGHVERVRNEGDARVIDIAIPAGLSELMVMHGSLAIDGVSLTVNDLPGHDRVQISLVEYTLRHTTLGDLREGDAVHVEADMLGKHVKRLMEARTAY